LHQILLNVVNHLSNKGAKHRKAVLNRVVSNLMNQAKQTVLQNSHNGDTKAWVSFCYDMNKNTNQT